MIRLFLALGLLASALALPARAESWRGIAPSRSTRADVEKVLGKPDSGHSNIYSTSNEKITVTYSKTPCAHGWRVPLDTVISVLVQPLSPLKFADLRLDESKFEERRDVHIETLYYYVNVAEGINYTVNAGGVTAIEYFPAAADNDRRCPVVKTTDSPAAKERAAKVDALLGPSRATSQPPIEEQAYYCSVHARVTSNESGFCPRCGRKLRFRRPPPKKKVTTNTKTPAARTEAAVTSPAEPSRPWATLTTAERMRVFEKLARTYEHTCQMHPEIHLAQEGECPKCGMALVRVNPLVRGEYTMTMASSPVNVQPGKKVNLKFSIHDPQTGARVKRFVMNHERLFHLFIVSQDLSEYQHIHPQLAADGSFSVATVLPRAGLYKLHADFFPVGGLPQVIQREMHTAGHHESKTAIPALTPDASLVRNVDGMTIALDLGGSTLTPGNLVSLKYRLADAQTGQPVHDLEPYLGAWGHTLILNPDQTEYLHSHPTDVLPIDSDAGKSRGGPEVDFKTMFPSTGAYRIWTQFQRAGKVTTVSFTVNVQRPTA